MDCDKTPVSKRKKVTFEVIPFIKRIEATNSIDNIVYQIVVDDKTMFSKEEVLAIVKKINSIIIQNLETDTLSNQCNYLI